MPMGTSMKASGSMTRHRDKDCINTSMDLSMSVLGSRTSSMVKVLRDGPIMHPTKENIHMERSTVLASSDGQTGLPTMESSEITISKAEESISGQMAESTQATGSTTRCTARASLLGLMADAMRATMYQIRRRAMESSNGKKSI
jgi:hypothetical protein